MKTRYVVPLLLLLAAGCGGGDKGAQEQLIEPGEPTGDGGDLTPGADEQTGDTTVNDPPPDEATSPPPPDPAVLATRNQTLAALTTVTDASARGVRVVVDSAAAQALLNETGFATLFQTASTTTANSTGSQALPDMTGLTATPATPADQALADVLGALLNEPVQDGDAIVYTPDATAFCAVARPDTADVCIAAMTEAQVVQVETAEGSGKLSIKFWDFEPVAIGYGADEVYFEADLNAVQAVELALVERGLATADPTMHYEGVIKLTLSRSADDAGGLLLSIPQPLNLAHGALAYQLAATENAIAITGDETAGSGTMALGLNAASLTITIELLYQTLTYDVAIAGATGLFTFLGNTEGQQMSAQGVGIRDEPVTMANTLVFEDGTGAISSATATLRLADFDMDADVGAGTLNFPRGFRMAFETTADLDDLPVSRDGFEYVINRGTRLSAVASAPASTVFRVDSGRVRAYGSGYFTGYALLERDDCGTTNAVDPGDLLISAVPCP